MNLENSYLIRSCEDEHTVYLCAGDIRHIYRDGVYMGWYRP